MNRSARGAAALGLVLVGGAGPLACRHPLAVEPGEPVFEVGVTGGIAGITQQQVFHVDGETECSGELCPPAGTGPVDPAVLEELLQDLARTGYFRGPDLDYGADCCDQFYFTFTARAARTERTVQGTPDRLPPTVARVVNRLQLLLFGPAGEIYPR